jgi:hypothetical protein
MEVSIITCNAARPRRSAEVAKRRFLEAEPISPIRISGRVCAHRRSAAALPRAISWTAIGLAALAISVWRARPPAAPQPPAFAAVAA